MSSTRQHPGLYYPMFLNNLTRLQWEHRIQFMSPLERLPVLPKMLGSNTIKTVEETTERAQKILAEMRQLDEYSTMKTRVIGPALSMLDLAHTRLADDRELSADPAHWIIIVEQLQLLSYERMVADLSEGCWLMIEPPAIDTSYPQGLPMIAHQMFQALRGHRGTVNKRDQCKEVAAFVEQFIEQEKNFLQGAEHAGH